MFNDKEKKIKFFDIVSGANRLNENKSYSPKLMENNSIKPKREFFEKLKKETEEIKEKPREKNQPIETIKEDDFLKDEIGPVKKEFKFKKYILIAAVLAAIAGGVYVALEILPRVEIKITIKKMLWNFNGNILASKNSGDIDLANKQIPANFFSEKKNGSFYYPATGKKNIEKKAAGEIIIYNAYSSQPQTFIASTRFESLEGKIFRIDKKIVVPAAKVENGKVIPASIKVNVIADEAGAEYNISPSKFTIPGLKGTPKYESFYARSEVSMAGGFIGEAAYPTSDDINVAKEKTEIALKENMNVLIFSRMPTDFKVIEGARQFKIIKQEIGQEVNQEGNFSVFAEGELTIAGFKEVDLMKLINGLAEKELGENFKPKEYSFKYGAVSFDAQLNKLDFSVNYVGTFWQPIDIGQFKNSILKKKEVELKIFIFSLKEAERAKISLWPFWVKKVPNNVEKVKVELE